MNEKEQRLRRPWQELDRDIAQQDREAVARCLRELGSDQCTHAIARLSEERQAELFGMLEPGQGAVLLQALPETQSARILHSVSDATAARLLEQLPSDQQADLLNQMPRRQADRILAVMRPDQAAEVRQLLRYARDSAGGLMIRQYLAYPADAEAQQVLADLRMHADRFRKYDVQYIYVLDGDGKLVGVVRQRDLLLADAKQPIVTLAVPNPVGVHVHTPLEELERLFDLYPYYGLPVLDEAGRLVGVVRRQDVEKAGEERTGRSLLKLAGIVGGDELRSMPWRVRAAKRGSWLTINLFLDLMAALVIAAYEDTLSAWVALAIFLPVLSDMSANAGVQAIAVSLRELTLGLLRPADVWHVVRKELTTSLFNALLLGGCIGLVAWWWKGMPLLGVVVGAAMALNLVIAACVGGVLPLLMRWLGQDPAMASGPILTTITDCCGFFLALQFARLALPYVG